MSRTAFQPGAATDHYHDTLGTPAVDVVTQLNALIQVGPSGPLNTGTVAQFMVSFQGATAGTCILVVNGVQTYPLPWDADQYAVYNAIIDAVPALADRIRVQVD